MAGTEDDKRVVKSEQNITIDMQQSDMLPEAITQKGTTDACVAYNSKSKEQESETEQVKSHESVFGQASFENHGEGKKIFCTH